MRKCLVIGSAQYDDANLGELPGAQADAENVIGVLVDAAYGAYDASSLMLLSPTLEQVRDALTQFILTEPIPEVFTFYFAGHGDVSGGSFFMLLKDSKLGQLSRTALGITELFSLVNEGKPQQVNIVIDACRAGGVVFDLSQAIKAEALGNHISPNISLLAAADIVQEAQETDEGGVATRALVRALRGDEATASTAPFLDLVMLGTHVATRVAETGAQQAPIVWGLNLTGASRFSRNPHAATSVEPLIGAVAGGASSSAITNRLQSRRDRLWRVYLDLGQNVDLAALSSELEASVELLDAAAGQASNFVLGLSYSLAPRARLGGEPFADAEVLAACAASLISVADKDPGAKAAIADIAKRFIAVFDAEFGALHTALMANWRALLSKKAGYGEFATLPLRISKLLGCIATASIVADAYDVPRPEVEAAAASTIQLIVSEFESSIVAFSDQQATFLSLFFASPFAVSNRAQAEQLFGLMFSDFLRRKGRLLATEFTGGDAFKYCWALATDTPMPSSVPLAVPTSLLAVLLTASIRFDLADTVDPYLHLLDHHSTNIYIPGRIEDFMQPAIPNGVNVTLSVGGEHGLGIFSVTDFKCVFDEQCRPILVKLSAGLEASQHRVAAAFACLTRPDRILWPMFLPVSLAETCPVDGATGE